MKNLVYESLIEFNEAKLNEEMAFVSESIFSDWSKALKANAQKIFQSLSAEWEKAKTDDNAAREFIMKLAKKFYIADAPEAGLARIKTWAEKAPIENIKNLAETAVKGKFDGRLNVTIQQGKINVSWTPMDKVNLENPFAGGGVGKGQTQAGV